jgi:Coenzyme PQQ synthesis protein D (PqqD)
VIVRSPSVLTAEVVGEIIMLSIERGHYFTLDDISGEIWKRIDPPCSFAELLDRLAADYDAERGTIRVRAADVRALLRRMAAQDTVRLIRCSGGSSPYRTASRRWPWSSMCLLAVTAGVRGRCHCVARIATPYPCSPRQSVQLKSA